MKKNIKASTLIVGALLVIGIAMVAGTLLPEATQYYVTVDEYLQKPMQYKDLKSFKLAGRVVKDSIVKDDTGMKWTFKVSESGPKIAAYYEGAMPDTFGDEADVVLTGTYQGDRFVATEVLAKCASRYEEKLEPPLMKEG